MEGTASKRVTFHGAFASRAEAEKKEREVGGFVEKKHMRSGVRYVVMTRRKRTCP